MLDKVLDTIRKHEMIKKGDRVVCALSGGADSVALLCALTELKDELGAEIYAANLNHSIRGEEGDGDSEFAQEFCDRLGVKLFAKKVDVPTEAKKRHMSVEECGREERYKLFDEACDAVGGALIATGHHKNDNAETVLFNLFRGSGAKGIKGIPYKRGNIIRPLLDVSRAETEQYLVQKGIAWREDSTNSECKYVRNKLRLVIIKEIEKVFPKAVDKITAAAEAVGQDEEYLAAEAERSGAFDGESIVAQKFLPLHECLRRRVVINALKKWNAGSIDAKKIGAVYSIVTGSAGKMADLGNNVRIVNNYGKISVMSLEREKNCDEEYVIKIGCNASFEAFGGCWSIKTVDKMPKMRDNKTMILFDCDKLGDEFCVRCRRDGDYMYPAGMEGRKKIKKVFIDLKIPKEKRDTIPLAVVGSEVLFIPGIRKSKSFAPTAETKRYCVVQYAQNAD